MPDTNFLSVKSGLLMLEVRYRSIILITASEKLITMGTDEKGTLRFVHDYMESRLSLLKSIEVSISK